MLVTMSVLLQNQAACFSLKLSRHHDTRWAITISLITAFRTRIIHRIMAYVHIIARRAANLAINRCRCGDV